ncbi:hypothetical protein HGM15179_009512, partial [Zosterops borbonicus]
EAFLHLPSNINIDVDDIRQENGRKKAPGLGSPVKMPLPTNRASLPNCQSCHTSLH